MPTSPGQLAAELDEFLATFDHVFSTVQWGGKLYKIPDPKRGRKKPKMFVFIKIPNDHNNSQAGKHLAAFFKLPDKPAQDAVKKYDWLTFSTFGDWGKKGWLDAQINNKRSLGVLKRLLTITYQQLPLPEQHASTQQSAKAQKTTKKQDDSVAHSSQAAAKIRRIMEGVTLRDDDDAFDRA